MKTIQRIVQYFFHGMLYLAAGGVFLIGFLRVGMLLYARPRTHLASQAPNAPIALVLGAGLNRDGTPGVVLRDRVGTAAQLYYNGTIKKLLMSGDNSTEFYDEPGAMREYALSLGIPDQDIILDFAGRCTYDSCYRAREIFLLDHIIIVTQAYHLPRALFLCNAFGIEADGVPADNANYHRSSYTFWWVREVLASANAYWDVLMAKPAPILGDPEPIFP